MRQPYDCLHQSMKTIETIVSIALFIIGSLAILSSAYPPTAIYTFTWITAAWMFMNIASFVIPFLCRPKLPKRPIEDLISLPIDEKANNLAEVLSLHLDKKEKDDKQQPQQERGFRPVLRRTCSEPVSYTQAERRTTRRTRSETYEPYSRRRDSREGNSSRIPRLIAPTPIQPHQVPYPIFTPQFAPNNFMPIDSTVQRNPSNMPSPAGSRPPTPPPHAYQSLPQEESEFDCSFISSRQEMPQPAMTSRPTSIKTSKEYDYSKQVGVLIDEAKAYISSFQSILPSEKEDLIADFEAVKGEEGTDEEKMFQLQKMHAGLRHYLRIDPYPYSTFTVEGIPNSKNNNCHVNVVLQVLAHNMFFDYLLWRPIEELPLNTYEPHHFDPIEKDDRKNDGQKAPVYDYGRTYQVRPFIKQIRACVEKMRQNIKLSEEDVPQLGRGDYSWILETLGVICHPVDNKMFNDNFLNRHPWPALILDNGIHCTVLIQKSPTEWYLVDDSKVTTRNCDYAELERERRIWQPVYLE